MKPIRQISALVAILVIGGGLFPVPGAVADPGWSYQRQITLDHGQVEADLTGFPVLISLSQDWLKDTDHGGHVAQPDGGDIRFLAADGSQLDHEVEEYDGTDGTLVAWVRIPFLSSSSDTEIYMMYGSPTCPDQWNPTGVWDTNYKMVHHLEERSGPHFDSTVNGNDGTPLGGVIQDASGILDGADDFDGGDDRISCDKDGGWSDERWGQQRAVIKDGKIYVVGGGIRPEPFPVYIFVFDLETGDVVQQSPSLGQFTFTASETAPVVAGHMVYAAPTKSDIVAWNTISNTIEWTTSGLSIWSNRIEHDGSHLYATTTDYQVVKVDVSSGAVVHSFNLDPDTDYENAVPPYLDEANGVVYAMGASNLYKLSASDLSEIWRRPIGSGCLETGSGHSRMAPILISDAYTGYEPWVIFGCWGTDIFHAYDADGNQEWSIPIPEGVRAVASYNPNSGYLYIPSQGDRIYVLDVSTGTELFSIDNIPVGSGFDRPVTVVHNDAADYLVFKTTGGTPRHFYIYDADTGDYVTRIAIGSDLFLVCFPVGVSAGYLVTGGSITNYNGLDGGIFAVKVGDGDPVDYYPLYGPYRYGYIENGITSLDLDGLNPTDEITLEAWANLDAVTSDGMNDHLVCRAETYCLKFAQVSAGDAPRFQLFDTEGTWHNLDLTTPLSAGQWHYLAGTWDGQSMDLYVDGNLEGNLPFAGTIDSTGSTTLIGSYSGGPDHAPDGRVDEVRISDVARGAEWIGTSYNNQISPQAFYTVGPEQRFDVTITKTPDRQTVPPGSDVSFTIAVTNTGNYDLASLHVVDALAPDCDRSLGELATGAGISYTCALTDVTHELTNTAWVSGMLPVGFMVTDTDTAVVDLLPSITVTKDAEPVEIAEPGGPITFTVRVDSTCAELLTISSLADSVHGDLDGQGACSLPQNLQPGGSYSCTFTALVTGSVGYQEIDEVTAGVNDDEGNLVEASDRATVTITVAPHVLVAPTELAVSEPEGSDTFTLSLTVEPTDTVVIDVSPSNAECEIAPVTVLLDDSNWEPGVTVTVTAVDDDVADGPQMCVVETAVASSGDPNYHGLDPQNVVVTVLDDDEAGVDVYPASLTVSEAGGYEVFTISLTSQPTAHVSIPLSLTNGECDVLSSPPVLDGSNWDVGLGVAVAAVDDDQDDGDQICIVQTGPASSDDANYQGAVAADVVVTVLDNDTTLRVYLPLILRGWPPVPNPNPISSPDCDGNYDVSWSAVSKAQGYVLQEATDCGFAGAVVIYTGADPTYAVSDRGIGHYCYRVMAYGSDWVGSWSDAAPVDVLVPPDSAPVLDPIDNADGDGSYPISWRVATLAKTYLLEEDTADDFPNPTTVYTGPSASFLVGGRGAGNLCYRSTGCNGCGCSDPSNVGCVQVLWEAEPNDDALSEANGPILPGPTYYGTLPSDGDIHDYFYFDLPVDQSLELWLTDIPSGHDYDLVLRDSSLTPPIGYSGEPGNSPEHIETGILATGRYYIQVYRHSLGGSTQPYHLRFDYR